MRFITGFALTFALGAVFAIAVGAHVAGEAGRLWDEVARRIRDATT